MGVSERESGSGARRWKTCGKRRRKFGSVSGSGEAGSASTSGEVNTLRLYLTCIRNTLEAAMCLQNFPCKKLRGNNKPEVDLKY
ncbi:uncharacterized protein LOC120692801 isoform X6 [Panicum virgatum]|uniref:uncharacterized protein LOC120692801 isoform X6 n=1 Tax=Panicum virgatum TaxID=38727 RepID=UPI0019D64030|nr:uncharacterized protein LOC120692801 isoform X6 [Panicum virgatum]